MTLNITIEGKPIVQQRPRLGKWRNFYDPSGPAKKVLAKALLAARVTHRMAPFKGDLDLQVRFYGTGPKCDLDNCIKAVCDAANKGVLWLDDRQVTHIYAEMVRVDPKPRTHIILREGV